MPQRSGSAWATAHDVMERARCKATERLLQSFEEKAERVKELERLLEKKDLEVEMLSDQAFRAEEEVMVLSRRVRVLEVEKRELEEKWRSASNVMTEAAPQPPAATAKEEEVRRAEGSHPTVAAEATKELARVSFAKLTRASSVPPTDNDKMGEESAGAEREERRSLREIARRASQEIQVLRRSFNNYTAETPRATSKPSFEVRAGLCSKCNDTTPFANARRGGTFENLHAFKHEEILCRSCGSEEGHRYASYSAEAPFSPLSPLTPNPSFAGVVGLKSIGAHEPRHDDWD